MSSITDSIPGKFVKDFMPVAIRMLAEGATSVEIDRAFKNYLGLKRRKNILKPPMKSALGIVGGMALLDQYEKNKASADSNAERRLYDLMKENGIRFKFQEDFEGYRLDYLIGDLVVEFDGPHHEKQKEYDAKRDRFLRRKGYEVMRIPVFLLDLDPRAIIEAIKEKS